MPPVGRAISHCQFRRVDCDVALRRTEVVVSKGLVSARSDPDDEGFVHLHATTTSGSGERECPWIGGTSTIGWA